MYLHTRCVAARSLLFGEAGACAQVMCLKVSRVLRSWRACGWRQSRGQQQGHRRVPETPRGPAQTTGPHHQRVTCCCSETGTRTGGSARGSREGQGQTTATNNAPTPGARAHALFVALPHLVVVLDGPVHSVVPRRVASSRRAAVRLRGAPSCEGHHARSSPATRLRPPRSRRHGPRPWLEAHQHGSLERALTRLPRQRGGELQL